MNALRDIQAFPLYYDWLRGYASVRTREDWVTAFRALGFYRAGFYRAGSDRDSELPAQLRLYRGSLEEFNRNLSWTPYPNEAQGYADLAGGIVWTALVPRDAILGAIHLSGLDEPYEYIVDVPASVEVVAYGAASPR